jgi:hypothetical protein
LAVFSLDSRNLNKIKIAAAYSPTSKAFGNYIDLAMKRYGILTSIYKIKIKNKKIKKTKKGLF